MWTKQGEVELGIATKASSHLGTALQNCPKIGQEK